mgnify:CR=1 FL=1
MIDELLNLLTVATKHRDTVLNLSSTEYNNIDSLDLYSSVYRRTYSLDSIEPL